MKITVVVRTFNRPDFFIQSLKSISEQSYKNWEVLIFDDFGSIENFNIYKNFKSNNPNNRVVYTTTSTAYDLFKSSWEYGITLSTGDVCIRLDDDDLLLPYTLSYISSLYNINNDLDFTYGSAKYFNNDFSLGDTIITKTPFESKIKHAWMPYTIPNNQPWLEPYYWYSDYYDTPTPFTSIIHASRHNVMCIYHLYTFRIKSVKPHISKVSISSSLCDDLEFFGSLDYIGLSHTSIKDILYLIRTHTLDRVTDLSNISDTNLSWPHEIERVRSKIDGMRSSGFTSRIIPINSPHLNNLSDIDIINWIKFLSNIS
jgi:glycosyltransferase involved in cell wall biosynthesis